MGLLSYYSTYPYNDSLFVVTWDFTSKIIAFTKVSYNYLVLHRELVQHSQVSNLL